MNKRFLSLLTAGSVLLLSGCTILGNSSGSNGRYDDSNAVAQLSGTQTDNNNTNDTENGTNTNPDGADTDNGNDNNTDNGSSGNDNSSMIPNEEEWKKLYLDFLDNDMDKIMEDYDSDWRNSWTMGFIYLNDDSVPELVISSGYEAAGNFVCTVINNEVKYYATSRLGLYYIERGNLIDNSDGHMGYYYDNIFKIGKDGFETVATGEYSVEYTAEEGDFAEVTTFMFNDEKLENMDEYQEKIKEYFDFDDITYFYDGTSYSNMVAYLSGTGYKDYKEAYKAIAEKGVEFFGDTLDSYVLMERDNREPMLICIGADYFKMFSFENGLLYESNVDYFSEETVETIYPGPGVVQSYYFYDNGSFTGMYRIENGSRLAEYISSYAKTDDNGELVIDKDGYPVYVYQVNGQEVQYKDFDKYIGKYVENYFAQIVPKDYDVRYTEYMDKNELLKALGY